jgi:TPP-dependent pyruvate/acetoin dehydrogenase alpha subunit
MTEETPNLEAPTSELLLTLYRKMTLIKAADERFRTLLSSGQLAIAYYSPRGQEAIPSAVSAHLSKEDYLITTYRGIHDQLAKGVPVPQLFAEYAGRATGTCKGKGGPMHITHPETGVMVTTGIVGSGLPIATGLALASVLKKDGRVTVCNFGDGATNIGAFHEALNLAAVWKLPVVFVCQNNLWAECTRYEFGTSAKTIADRAIAYGIPGETVDGNDPVAVWRAAGKAIERARSGAGPTLLEAKTFRFMGHYFGDNAEYIPKHEFEDALSRDPYPKYRETLIRDGAASAAELDEIDRNIKEEIDNAVTFALESPYPDVSEVRRDVYAHEVLE